MGSKQKQTKQLQKEKLERLLAKRKALLLERGIEKDTLVRDKVVEHLQAEISRVDKALASISAREKLREEVRLRKHERAEKKKMEKSKLKEKKVHSAPPEREKKEKKGKKEKQEKGADSAQEAAS